MKTSLKILTIALTIFFGCKDNSTSYGGNDLQLKGQIIGWQSETYQGFLEISTSNAPHMALDSTAISQDGSFTITLPLPSPPDSLLGHFNLQPADSNQYMSKVDQRVYSNPNAKYAELSLILRDKREGFWWPLYCGNTFVTDDSLSQLGDYHVAYYFFSQPTNISGSYRVTFYDTTVVREHHHSSFVTNYSLNLSAGWNAILTRISFDNNGARIYSVSSGNGADMKWYAAYFISRGFELASSL